MGIAFDLKLDTSNDITIGDTGDLVLTTKRSEMCMQTLSITLNTFQGEWFLNTNFGIPYIQQIVGVARKKESVDKIFLAALADNDYVDSIVSYTSSFDRDNRYYSIQASVQVAEEVVSTTFSTRPSDEYYYPTPSTESTVTCSKYTLEPFAGELYYFENIDGLPFNTYATWWNEWSGSEITEIVYVTDEQGQVLLTSSGANLEITN